jgi:dCMP deaminase
LNIQIKASKLGKYLPIATSVAELSKATNTKVGAVILDVDCSVLSVGYNGAPVHCDADLDEDHRKLKPEKYYWTSHAETNAIAQAAKVGVALRGSSLVCTHIPCMACARTIVQAGVKVVAVYEPDERFLTDWYQDITRTVMLFSECHVILFVYDRNQNLCTSKFINLLKTMELSK